MSKDKDTRRVTGAAPKTPGDATAAANPNAAAIAENEQRAREESERLAEERVLPPMLDANVVEEGSEATVIAAGATTPRRHDEAEDTKAQAAARKEAEGKAKDVQKAGQRAMEAAKKMADLQAQLRQLEAEKVAAEAEAAGVQSEQNRLLTDANANVRPAYAREDDRPYSVSHNGDTRVVWAADEAEARSRGQAAWGIIASPHPITVAEADEDGAPKRARKAKGD